MSYFSKNIEGQPLEMLDGSVSAPAYSFANDTDTGFYSYSADGLGVALGGVEVARFDSDGFILNDTFTISNNLPKMVINDANGTTDEKNWFYWISSAGNFNLSTSLDASPTILAQNAITLARTGTNVDKVRFYTDGALDLELNSGEIAGNIIATQAEIEAETAGKLATTENLKYYPYSAKAWVNFDGTGTVAINESQNVSSITDNDTGDYTINFTDDFASANYCLMAQLGDSSATNHYQATEIISRAVSDCNIMTFITSGAAGDDVDDINLVFFGELA